MVPVSMTLSDPDPDFKVAVFSKSNMSQRIRDRSIATKEQQFR